MTDRELLVSIQEQIEEQLQNPIPPILQGDLTLRLPDSPEGTPKGYFNGWVWPMPVWNGEDPVISSGFNRYQVGEPGDDDYERQHLGVDCCYKNDEARVPNPPEWTKWYHCPSNTIPMLAMGPGHIWSAEYTSTGWTVKVDHHAWCGFPLVTYYTHMSELFIDEWAAGAGGLYVYAGFQLGYVGNDPEEPDDDINHSHTELWDYSEGVGSGRVNRSLNPEEYFPHFGKVVLAQPLR